MDQFLKSKLTKRYLIISLVLVFFALSLLYIITVRVMDSSVQEEIDYRNQTLAKTVGKNTDYIMDNAINDLRLISEKALATKDGEYVNVAEMENILSRNPILLYSEIFDEEGRSLYVMPGFTASGAEEISGIVERTFWSRTYYLSDMFTLDNGRKVIALTYPILEGERMGGVAVAYLNLEVLSQYLNQVKIGEQGFNGLIDGNGQLVGYSDFSVVGTDLSDHPISEALYRSKSGVWEGEVLGENMLIAYRPVRRGGYGVIVGEPVSQVLASTSDVEKLLLKGFLLVFFLTFAFTVFATSKIVKPIRFLTLQTREYKEGSRSHFEQLKTGDELQDLSVMMDEMAQQLSSKEKKLFNILESIPYAVITTNKKGNIETFNKGAEALTSFAAAEVKGTNIRQLPITVSPEDFLAWDTLRDGKKVDELERGIIDKNGAGHIVRIYSSLFYDEKDRNIGAIYILRDVSEIKQLEGYLKQSERLASLGQLTAGIAHEIKNPLSIIIAASDAIELELEDEVVDTQYIKEMTTDIIETSERMNHLLTDFLKMSRGDMEEKKTNFDLIVFIDELLSLLRKKLEDQGIEVEFQSSPGPLWVSGAENQLNQVFLNILINSIQAMEKGGTLVISVQQNTPYYEISVTDTGKGIGEAEIDWIFNPFYTTKKEGTGLGLAIAYEIISRHDGKIKAESSAGRGTKIIVNLPQGKGSNVDEQYSDRR